MDRRRGGEGCAVETLALGGDVGGEDVARGRVVGEPARTAARRVAVAKVREDVIRVERFVLG